MNNGYEFNNEYYKNIVNNMKLTIFDIIANEEAKLSKAADILNNQPEGTDISKGVELYNNQKNCITNMTLLANDLSSIFSQFDYNSYLIDNTFSFENPVETVENQVNENMNANQEHETIVNDTENSSINSISQDSTETSDSIDTVKDEIGIPQEIVETPVEENVTGDMIVENEKVSQDIVGSSANNDSTIISNESTESSEEIVPVENEISTPEIDTESTDVITPAEGEVNASEVVSETTDVIAPTEGEVNASEVVSETTDAIAPTEDEVNASEAVSETTDVITPAEDEVNASEVVSESTDVIAPIVEQSIAPQDNAFTTEENAPKVEETADSQEIVASVAEETPDEKEKTTVIPADSLDDDVVEEKLTDDGVNQITSLTEEKVDDTTSEEKIDFVAVDPVFSRAILVTKKQTKNLRGSLSSKTQEFNSFVLKNKNVSDKELIDNGLLEPVDNIEEKIEKMMEDANNLYKEGKTDEAQALYEKISELNSQLKETSVSK